MWFKKSFLIVPVCITTGVGPICRTKSIKVPFKISNSLLDCRFHRTLPFPYSTEFWLRYSLVLMAPPPNTSDTPKSGELSQTYSPSHLSPLSSSFPLPSLSLYPPLFSRFFNFLRRPSLLSPDLRPLPATAPKGPMSGPSSSSRASSNPSHPSVIRSRISRSDTSVAPHPLLPLRSAT